MGKAPKYLTPFEFLRQTLYSTSHWKDCRPVRVPPVRQEGVPPLPLSSLADIFSHCGQGSAYPTRRPRGEAGNLSTLVVAQGRSGAAHWASITMCLGGRHSPLQG